MVQTVYAVVITTEADEPGMHEDTLKSVLEEALDYLPDVREIEVQETLSTFEPKA